MSEQERTLHEKLHDANVLSSGALFDVPPIDVITAKMEKDSHNKHNLK